MSSDWDWAEVTVSTEELTDGVLILRNKLRLAEYPSNLVSWLRLNARRYPDKPFLQERNQHGEWEGKTYRETLTAVNQIGHGLLQLKVAAAAPLAILSENCIDMALVQLAAMQIGQPIVPISYAYSVRSQTGSHIRHIMDTTESPILVMSDANIHMKKLGQWDLSHVQLFAFSNAEGYPDVQPFSALCSPGDSLSGEGLTRFAEVTPRTLAKIQFTSGSTGLPKGVMITHGMMASNQAGVAQIWPFLDDSELIVDWLPWNHTFGGNYVFNMIMQLGGTFYLDNGSPTPEGFQKTVENIIDVSPTMYFGVPRSYAALYDRMKSDGKLRSAFFRRLKFIFTAAAALDQVTYEGMRAMSKRERGEEVPFFSAWGCTETAPSATNVYWHSDDSRVIGLPLPGVAVKLAPDDTGKLELRVKGPNVTSGYYNDTVSTELAFDDDGYYRTGDAGKLVDAKHPESGLLFDGRIGEDFKLTSGVWAHNAALRGSVNQLGQPFLIEVVVAAPNREFLTALIYPNITVLRGHFPEVSRAFPDDEPFLRNETVTELFRDIFRRHNAMETGSSRRFERFALLDEVPQIDRNETTDKGYINQRAVLTSHSDLVDRLYLEQPPDEVIVI
jgi:feruloyl-CoA synthase